MKYPLFILVFIVISSVITYSLTRGCQVLREYPLYRTIFLTLGIALFVSFIAGMALSSVVSIPSPVGRAIALIGHSSLLLFIYLILSFLLVDVLRIVNYFLHFAPAGMLFFRQCVFAGSLVLIVVAMLVGNYQYNHPKVVHLELTAENTTLQGKELRIVVASDLHLGVLNDKQHALRFVDLINAHRPDIVLLAGDICDSDLRSIVRQNMNEELQQVKAPLGVYASIGNHEYIGGDVDACVAYLETGNVKVLRDASILVDSSFYIVGRDDRSNIERLPLSELMVATDSSKPRIVLDHQPFHLEEAEENGVSLQVSGHTHDGQFFPITLLVRSMYENAHGYSKRGRTHYYVSSGLGLWGPPYRIGSQSELVVIRWKY